MSELVERTRDTGTDRGVHPTIAGYEVIVEQEKPKPDRPRSFDVTLPASVTAVTVSPQFLRTNTDYKFEVLAIEQGGNQTITEGSFKTAP